MKHLIYLGITLIFLSCSANKVGKSKPTLRDDQAFSLTEVSTDSTYGRSNENPVQTGGGPTGEESFLNALAGPNGERIKYKRLGSCCPVKSKNGLMGI